MITLPKTFSICVLFFYFLNISAQDYAAVDDHARNVGISENFEEAAIELTDGYDDQLLKARAIFSWIAHHIDYDHKILAEFRKTGKRGGTQFSYTSEEEKTKLIRENNLQRIKKTLISQKGVCQDYSLLFQFMCESVGIECVYIRGFGRFSPTNIGKTHKRGNHAWNAINIDNKWHLIDVTWSTGMGSKSDYGNGYFNVDPELFIFSHYPDEKKWQLLDEIVDVATFANLPFTYSGFLKYKISSFNPSDGYIDRKSKISVDLDIPEEEQVLILRGKKPVNLNALKEGSKYTFDLSKKAMSGSITLAVTNKGYIEPILTMRVK